MAHRPRTPTPATIAAARTALLALAIAGTCPALAPAQSDADLARRLANPIASLVSVPFQFNYDRGFDPDDGDRLVLNVQPVVPIDLSADWNAISRTILPVVYADGVVPGVEAFGLGDVTQSLFLSPKAPWPGGIIWGAGPVALLPTATDTTLGAGRFGLGPTVVALKQTGGFTYGALANHVWSVAGHDDRRDVNATLLQPFLSYTTPGATTFSLSSETTYDWDVEQASVPLNAVVSQLVGLGGQNVQFALGARLWIAAPDGGPEGFGARAQITLLFPQ